MQIHANDIARQLQQQALPPFILLFGDEPQQKLDIVDAVRRRARELAFDERQTFTLDSDFEWSQLIDAMQSMSLFSEKQYIELTMTSAKPGTAGAKQFQEIANMDNPDVVLLIQGPKAGKDVQKTKWFSALANKAWFCHVYDLEGAQLQKWLNVKAQELQLNIDLNAISALATMCEGNIMAGRQELEKLALLHTPSETITVNDVLKVMVQQSRYSSFQFTDEVLKGDMRKAVKMLSRLEDEGMEPVVILWSLVNEAQTLAKMRDMQNTQGQINFRSLRVWPNKQGLYQTALNRLSDHNINQLIEQLSQTDVLFKSTTVAKPYVVLSHLALLFLPSDLEAYALA